MSQIFSIDGVSVCKCMRNIHNQSRVGENTKKKIGF